jgi:hypothetical protein
MDKIIAALILNGGGYFKNEIKSCTTAKFSNINSDGANLVA